MKVALWPGRKLQRKMCMRLLFCLLILRHVAVLCLEENNEIKVYETIKCHCSLACWLWRLLTGSLRQSDPWAQPHRQSVRDKDGCCGAADVSSLWSGFPGCLRICGISLLLAISSGDRQGRLATLPILHAPQACPEQTPPGAAEEVLPWPAVTLKFTSVDHLEGSLTKDGVGSTERPCLDKRMSEMGSNPVWCG